MGNPGAVLPSGAQGCRLSIPPASVRRSRAAAWHHGHVHRPSCTIAHRPAVPGTMVTKRQRIKQETVRAVRVFIAMTLIVAANSLMRCPRGTTGAGMPILPGRSTHHATRPKKKAQLPAPCRMPCLVRTPCSPEHPGSLPAPENDRPAPASYALMTGSAARRRICNSFSCFSSTTDGAWVSRHCARWVFGKAMTSRMDSAPVIMVTIRSRPKARPP